MAVRKRLEALSRKRGFGWVGTAMAIQARYSELNGISLASAVTLATFLSLFPLLLFAGAVVGFVAADTPDFAAKVVDTMGLTGAAADTMTQLIASAEHSRQAASIIGLLGLLWAGLGLVAATQYAVNSPWQMAGRGIKDKVTALLWLAGVAPLVLASFSVSAGLNFLPGWMSPLGVLLGVAINVAIWLWTMKILLQRKVGWRALLPGAVVGAIGLEILKLVGTIYVPRLVASASALYGSLGVVFAILAWMLFFGRLLVYANVVNVVRWERAHGTLTVEVKVPNAPPKDDKGTRAGEVEPEPKAPDDTGDGDAAPPAYPDGLGRPEVRAR